MITTQLPDGTAVHHQHDQAGRLTYNKYTDGSWEAWEYDKAGRLTKAYNRDSVTEFVRNALGQVIKETQDGRTVEHRYDERSRLSNIVSALEGNITYGYDMKGSVNHISAGMSGKRKPWEANIAYDRLGRETSRMMPGCGENTMHYDSIGRPAHQRVQHNGRTLLDKSYLWGDNLRLLQTLDTINRRSVRYDYDTFGSLSGAVYGDGSCQWRNPDAMGNVYDSPDRTDRSYGRGGQLREDKKWRYYYDSHGNLVLKTMRRSGPSLETGMRDEFLAWQSGDYAYTWQGNGMLRSVTRPDGKTVTFKYAALGRRIEKVFDGRVYRYLWDGDVILHEWDYAEADRPNTIVTETGEVTLDRPEPVENLITWVYDSDSYVPTAKIVGDKHYSIVSDYIGRPVQAYDDNGNIVWQADYDIYGNLRNLNGSRQFIPFRQLGQYEDEETGLYYNRFRYYDPNTGTYISQDPISILGGVNTFAYVFDCNIGIDIMGLTVTVAQVDKYGELLKNSTVGDDLEFHHIPQDKLGFLPRKEGIAVVMPKSEHAMTRTYKTKGRITASLDKNRAFKDILKDDLVDLRKISPKYDDAIIKIIKGYEDLDMIGKGELTLSKIIESCK
ncbi:RHS repeat-associated core domain-containing protein [Prevotella jejuni]